MLETRLYHYTDGRGYDAIRSQPEWIFKVSTPPGNHPRGVYFTRLGPDTSGLAKKLRVPVRKLEYVFVFTDGDDLMPIRGGRGDFVFYSPIDYTVDREHQIFAGTRERAKEYLP